MSDSNESGITYTRGPIRPEHTNDEIVAEDQPDAEDASPTPQSPDYVPESNPEADQEEDDDETLRGPVDYSADGGDDGDDEDEPSEEDEDEDVDMEADGDEKEEEHLVPVDFVVVALPAIDQAPSAKETEPFETDESAPTHHQPHPVHIVVSTRISIPAPILHHYGLMHRYLSPSLTTIHNPPPVYHQQPPPSPIPFIGLSSSMIREEVRPRFTLLPSEEVMYLRFSFFFGGRGYESIESSLLAAARLAGGSDRGRYSVCDFRDAEGRPEEIYKDERVEEN
ncbi:hypothetical protein Tco_1353936 [Tanacetum coccineum]